MIWSLASCAWAPEEGRRGEPAVGQAVEDRALAADRVLWHRKADDRVDVGRGAERCVEEETVPAGAADESVDAGANLRAEKHPLRLQSPQGRSPDASIEQL